MTYFKKACIIAASFFSFCILFSCGGSQIVSNIEHEELFTLPYGSFEDEIDLFSLSSPGQISTFIQMKDGFFFISNGETNKLIQMNSYGDLLGIFYNPDMNPVPSFINKLNPEGTNIDSINHSSTQQALAYSFNRLGKIAVDYNKTVYAVDILPFERQEQDIDNKLLLNHAVLRFSNDGTFIDYLGQQGPGGTPFPFIKNIFTTKNNELVVICLRNSGYIVYWFTPEGYLKYTIPIDAANLPVPSAQETFFSSLDEIIPDYSSQKLYLKIDYHRNFVDPDSNVVAGVEFYGSRLYPLDIDTGLYGEPLIIPPFEDIVSEGYTKLTFSVPFNFLGTTESGWFFFIIPDKTGFMVQMVQPNGQKILKRHFNIDQSSILYHSFTLSQNGIISALLADKDKARVVWWRTDQLIESLLN